MELSKYNSFYLEEAQKSIVNLLGLNIDLIRKEFNQGGLHHINICKVVNKKQIKASNANKDMLTWDLLNKDSRDVCSTRVKEIIHKYC